MCVHIIDSSADYTTTDLEYDAAAADADDDDVRLTRSAGRGIVHTTTKILYLISFILLERVVLVPSTAQRVV